MGRNPGFTLTGVMSVALGIGATTAVFSLIWSTHIRVSRRGPDCAADDEERSGRRRLEPERRTSAAVAAVSGRPECAGHDFHPMTLTGHDYPENVRAVSLIANGFRDLGLRPFLGWGLLPWDAVACEEPQPVRSSL